MRLNRQIQAERVRVIDERGEQVGVYTLRDALMLAEKNGLDLIEIAPNASPPVCKMMDFGKFRYQQTKKEKEGKKSQHQIKVKEIKLKPNIDEHDLKTKIKHAREFLEKGNKVKVTCVFRGREMLHIGVGEKIVQVVTEELKDISVIEAPMKLFGQALTMVLAPGKDKPKH